MRRAVLSLVVLAVAGCGNQQSRPPDVSVPATPTGSTPVAFDTQGVRFAAPGGWHVQNGQSPLVAVVQSGTASIAVWRYARSEPLPATKAQLAQARDLLLKAAQARDQTFKATRSAITRVDRHPAIVVSGTETISGQPRTVRSTHVYAGGGEVVVDAFAPGDVFARVDREAFVPLVRSLRVRAP